MSIEKIEIEFRALIGPDAETLSDGVRLGALIRTGRALLDELSRLREALELISEGRGVCGTCGEFAEGPGSGVTMCDNGYCVWEPQDPQKIAARALSTQVEERE